MIEPDIDFLFDVADAEQMIKDELLKRIDKPVVRSYRDFLDGEGEIISLNSTFNPNDRLGFS